MTTPIYNQSEREAMQEREILRLRARLAKAEKHLANLRRMHEHDQRHIARLSARIRKLEKDHDAHLFRRLE